MEERTCIWDVDAIEFADLPTVGELVRAADAPGTQLSLFEPGRARAAEKEEKLARTVDALRQKYGPLL